MVKYDVKHALKHAMEKVLKNWLVVWLPCFIFPYIGLLSSSQWTFIFFRGVGIQPPTSFGGEVLLRRLGLKSRCAELSICSGLIVMDLTEDLKKKVSTRPHLSAVGFHSKNT